MISRLLILILVIIYFKLIIVFIGGITIIISLFLLNAYRKEMKIYEENYASQKNGKSN